MNHNRFRTIGVSAAALATIAIAFGVQASFGAPPSAPSAVVVVDPARILDTRSAVGVPGTTPVGAGTSIDVQVTGVGGVPADATGVVVTLTATGATSNTFITATPTGSTRSTTSVLNVSPGVDIANTITVGLGTGGKVSLFNNSGNVHLIADVTGYLEPSGVGGGAPTTTTPPSTPTVENRTADFGAYAAAHDGTAGTPGVFGCLNVGASGDVYLDLPLPDGAAVTSIDFHVFDNSLGNFTLLLLEVDNVNGIPTTSGTLSGNQTQTTGSVGYLTVSETVNGGDKAGQSLAVGHGIRYMAQAISAVDPGTGNSFSFCGVTVHYSIEVS